MNTQIKTDKRGHKTFWRDGKRLPSPSAVVNRFKDAGGLIYWANQRGLEGLTLDDARDVVTTPGTITHAMIEADIRGRDFDREHWDMLIKQHNLDYDAIWSAANSAWTAYQSWRTSSKLELLASEVSMVSDRHAFGGTFDAVAVHDRLALIDWKTGSLYPDHLIQMGGYVVLWEENMSERLDGIALLSVSKDHGGFTHVEFPRDAMQIAVDQFLALLECYRRDKILKRMV
jgi:hypothetical protein